MAKKHSGSSEHHYPDHEDVMGHGCRHATHEIHGGKTGVPNELRVGSGPENSRETRSMSMARSNFEGGASTKGKAKGMKVYDEE